MYGLSSHEDLTFLIGRELIQVCIGRQQAALHFFPEGVSIFIETDIRHISPGGATSTYETIPRAASALTSLLNAVIANAEARPPGTLSIRFESGDILEFDDTSPHYESYQIKHNGRTIVV